MQYPNFFNTNNNNNNNMIPSQMMGTQYLPRMQVIKVNGEAGARNLRMAPNSTKSTCWCGPLSKWLHL